MRSRSLYPRILPWLTAALLLAILLATLLAGCKPGSPVLPAGSCTLGLEPRVDDEAAIRAVLHAEGELVVRQEIDALMALWGEGSSVVDAKNSPNDSTDDQAWIDKDAVRHRYVRTVFPGNPLGIAPPVPADLTLAVVEDRAVVTATTRIGDEISPAGDRWELARVRDCWVIDRLTYNLEPRP